MRRFSSAAESPPQQRDADSLILSIAGSIGLCGLNSAGIGLCTNTLLELDFNVNGLPVLFVVRSALEYGVFSDVERFLSTVPHASGQNYLIASPADVRSLECSSTKVIDYVPLPGVSRRFHANNALVNDDNGYVLARLATRTAAALSGSPTSEFRFASLRKRLGDPRRNIAAAEIFAALSSKDNPQGPICRDGDTASEGAGDAHIGFTVASVLYELQADPVLHIAAGPPSESAYRKIRLGSLRTDTATSTTAGHCCF